MKKALAKVLLNSRFIATALVLWSFAVAGSSAVAKGVNHTNQELLQRENIMNKHPFGISGNEYWDNILKNESMLLMNSVASFKRELLADAAPLVDLSIRPSAPLGVLYTTRQDQSLAWPLDRYGLVVASRIDDRKVSINFLSDQSKPMPRAEGDMTPSSNISVGSIVDEDLSERIDLNNGNYLIRVVLGSLVSNDTMMTVQGGVDIADREASVVSETKIYNALEELKLEHLKPEVMSDHGVALSLIDSIGEDKKIFSGSFRTAALDSETLEQAEKEGLPKDENGQAPHALIPISFLALSDDPDNYGPYRLDLTVPAYLDKSTGSAQNEVVGNFSIDLTSMPGIEAVQNVYYVYCFMGSSFAGPLELKPQSGK